MKKKLGFLFAVTICVVMFGSCNNAGRDPTTGVSKKDTAVLKVDSNAVKEKKK